MSWIAEEHDPDWPFQEHATRFDLDPARTALLVIDLQAGDLVKDPDSDYGRKYPDVVAYWNRRLAERVMPNTRRLIDFFRSSGMRVLYTRNGAITPHGSEMTARLKSRISARIQGRHRGTPAYDIAREIYPADDELVVDKLASGAFNSSMLDHALRNMGIADVVIAGILTDMCVLGSARVASEIGYNSLICEDACGTLTQRAHDEALLVHARVMGRVSGTDDVIRELAGRANPALAASSQGTP